MRRRTWLLAVLAGALLAGCGQGDQAERIDRADDPVRSARPVSFPDAPPPTAGCPGDVVDHRDINHRTLGEIRLFLQADPLHRLNPPACVVAVTGSGQTLPHIPIDSSPDRLAFANPATDATGNAFIIYNPGRYNGVLVLVPTAGGFEDIGWDDKSGTHYSGRRAYYNAELGGIGTDGNYPIRQFRRETPPGCMGSVCQITISLDLQWNGTDYVPAQPPSCDEAAISRDLGQRLVVHRCHGDWAYVSIDETGQAPSLLRLDNGTWTRYTGFPSGICKDAAQADGVPAAELSSFPC